MRRASISQAHALMTSKPSSLGAWEETTNKSKTHSIKILISLSFSRAFLNIDNILFWTLEPQSEVIGKREETVGGVQNKWKPRKL